MRPRFNTDPHALTTFSCRKSDEVGELLSKLKMAESRAESMERLAQEGAKASESKLHSIEASLTAQLMHAQSSQLDSEAKINDLKALLEAASSREAVLESECQRAVMKVQSLEQDLSKAAKEVNGWQMRCSGYEQELAAIAEERDEARKLASSKSKEAQQLSLENARSREVAVRIQADLQGQDKMRKELQQRLDEMISEAQAMRHQAMVSGSPLSRKTTRPVEDSGGMADQHTMPDADVEESFKRMTISELKLRLTNAGMEDKVWEMSSRKPAAKKEEWVKLAMAV